MSRSPSPKTQRREDPKVLPSKAEMEKLSESVVPPKKEEPLRVTFDQEMIKRHQEEAHERKSAVRLVPADLGKKRDLELKKEEALREEKGKGKGKMDKKKRNRRPRGKGQSPSGKSNSPPVRRVEMK